MRADAWPIVPGDPAIRRAILEPGRRKWYLLVADALSRGKMRSARDRQRREGAPYAVLVNPVCFNTAVCLCDDDADGEATAQRAHFQFQRPVVFRPDGSDQCRR